MEENGPMYLDVEQAIDYMIDYFGKDLKIGMPLGLGKPVHLINGLYNRVKNNPELTLTMYTALSFEIPIPASDLEKRLMLPFFERQWEGVPELDYMKDLRQGKLAENVILHEMYNRAGAYVKEAFMQQDHISSNYTHTVRDVESNGNQMFSQEIAKKETADGVTYSTACNADTALETLATFKEAKNNGEKKLCIGIVNNTLPYMYGDGEVPSDMYDIIIDDPKYYHPLFATPRQPISVTDYMIGLNVSTLVRDNGTLQIGIGALGDAIASALITRNSQNDAYQQIIQESGIREANKELIETIGGTTPFEKGLYGSTEMLVDGFLQLYKANIIKRKVYHHTAIQKLINDGKLEEAIPSNILNMMIDEELINPYLTENDFNALQRFGIFKDSVTYDKGDIVCDLNRYSALLTDPDNLKAVSENCLGTVLKNGVLLTGSFFLGPHDFYKTLLEMSEEELTQFEMTGVEVANQLYGNEKLRALQRKDGRFCNAGMKATLLGAVASGSLEDGTIISGVGGQYNFVSMAHALPDGRSVIMIKSTRQQKGQTLSNIVYNYGHTTIPKHLRDIVVSEYGIADIRGKSDQEIIKAMLNITDSRFQDELLAKAKKNGKIPEDYVIPEKYRNNTPAKLAGLLQPFKDKGVIQDFPFGMDLTGEELFTAAALKALSAKAEGPEAAELPQIMQGLPDEIPESLNPFFERMELLEAGSPEEKESQKLLLTAFKLAGFF